MADPDDKPHVVITGGMGGITASMLSALAAAGIPATVMDENTLPRHRQLEPWELGTWDPFAKPKPINTGRRAEKEARALEKAQAKRDRKAAKRLRDAAASA